MDAAMRGEILEGVPMDADAKVGEVGEGETTTDYGKPPPPTEFLLDMPNISAVDLCALTFHFSSFLITNTLQ